MAQATLDFTLTHEEFLDLVDTAGFAIGCWARPPAVVDEDVPSYTVQDHESGDKYVITPASLSQTIADIWTGNHPGSATLQNASIWDDLRRIVVLRDMGAGILTMNYLVQQHCFLKLVYS